MTKRVLILFVLLAAIVYGAFSILPTSAQTQERPTATVTVTKTVTATATSTPIVCVVTVGRYDGLVNLRSCGSTSCAVLMVLSSGEVLTVIQSGAWLEVKTESGAYGWIYSKLCRGE